MTSASVSNVVLNPDITQMASTRVKQASSDQDFGKIMSQAKEKVQQTDSENSPTMEKKTDKANEVTKSSNEMKNDSRTNLKENNFKKENVSNQDMDTVQIDDTKIEEIEAATEELLQYISEELDITVDELEEMIAAMGIMPVELFDSNNVANLLVTLTEDGNMIGLVADENLYTSLQDIVQMADEILAEKNIEPEELELSVEQFKMADISEDNKIIDFATVLENVNSSSEHESKDDVRMGVNEQITETTVETSEVDVVVEQVEQNKSESKDDKAQTNDSNNEMPTYLENLKENATVEVNEAEVETQTPMPSTENILRQLADSIRIQKGENPELTKMEISLHPSSLGNVNVSLTTKGGIVTAQFTAQNETVKHAIETQVVQLRNDLEEQGVKVEAIEVSVASHQMERNLEQGNDKKDSNESNKTDKIHKIRRSNINLNLLNENGEIEAFEDEDDAVKIAREMMAINGNTMDLLA